MRYHIALTGALVVGLTFLSPASAKRGDESRVEDEAPDAAPLSCLSLRRITGTEVVDERTILFYARGNRIYENKLPKPCPDLERTGRFIYETNVNRVCASDSITVVRQSSSRFNVGSSCLLGSYDPVSKPEAKQLVEIARYGKAKEAEAEVKVTEVPVEPESDTAAPLAEALQEK